MGRLWTAGVALALLSLAPAGARADVGSPRKPIAIFTPGPTVEWDISRGWIFGGEAALSQYVGRWGYGAAFGGNTAGRMYGELQLALALGGKTHNVVLGLNPGAVIDVNGETPRYGGQATFWFNYARGRRYQAPLASPLVPFVRGQMIPGPGLSLSFGVMLKLPLRP